MGDLVLCVCVCVYVCVCGYLCLSLSLSLCQVLVRMKQYKDDLLASCLHLLLCLPKELVEHELEALVPALQVCT